MKNIEKINGIFGYKVKIPNFNFENDFEKYKQYFFDFIDNSNMIEGIFIDSCETISEGEPLPELAPELADHYKSLEYMLKNYNKHDLTFDNHNKIHQLLMKSFLKNAGGYRKHKCWIGRKGCPYFGQIPNLMKDYIKKVKELEKKDKCARISIFDLHALFEIIHPRTDGNGREGRIAFNWLNLKYRNEFYVFLYENVQNYYKFLESFHEKFRQKNPNIKFYKNFTKEEYKKLKQDQEIHRFILMNEKIKLKK